MTPRQLLDAQMVCEMVGDVSAALTGSIPAMLTRVVLGTAACTSFGAASK